MEPERPREKALAYLHDHNVMTLATTGPQGVWAAAVFYVNDGFTLYFLSAPASRHSINIAAYPGVAITVQADYADWRAIKGIQLEGTALCVTGAEQAKAIGHYGVKFPLIENLVHAPDAIVSALRRIVWYKVVPSRLYVIDNALGFGHRDEVLLQE